MKPVVHGLEAEYWDRVDFIYLDREEGGLETASQYGVGGQPVFILLDANGSEINRWFGYVNPDTLTAALDEILASGG